MRGASGRLRTILAAALLLAACRGEAPSHVAERPAPGRRLAVLAPAAAETLALLDARERVVAVGDWVAWPPEMAALPKLGAYDAPSAERLLALRVDTLVTTASAAGRQERAELARLGIEVVELDTSTFAGTLESIATVGRLVDREAAATGLVAAIRARVDAVARRSSGLPARRVLAVVGRDPLYVAGPGSHFDELIRLVGAENVAADAGSPYALVSLETVLARRPEVILDCSDNRPGAPRGAVAGDWARWPFLPAVARNQVYQVDPTRIAIPGPRLAEMAELVGRLVRPERFGAAAPAELTALGAESPP
jgi:ABC-type Fe3+-hydroxamate transport system substrate-binding protein